MCCPVLCCYPLCIWLLVFFRCGVLCFAFFLGCLQLWAAWYAFTLWCFETVKNLIFFELIQLNKFKTDRIFWVCQSILPHNVFSLAIFKKEVSLVVTRSSVSYLAKYYSPTFADNKTFAGLVFCNSVEFIHCCKKLGRKFCLLQRWMNSTLAVIICSLSYNKHKLGNQ